MIDQSGHERLIARLEAVPFTRWHLRPRLIVGSATFFDAFDTLSLAFVLPALIPLWGLSARQVGWLIAAGYLGQLLGALVFGAAAERFGRIRSTAAATGLMSVMSLACATSDSFPALLAMRLVQGLGVGGEMPVAAVYINELSKAQGRGRFLLLYESIFPIGLMVAGLIGAVVVPAFGWRVMFLIGGIPGLLIAAAVLQLPESPRWLISKGRLAQADAIVSEMEASVGLSRSPGAESHVPTRNTLIPSPKDRARNASWAELLSPFYRRRTLVVWTLWGAAGFFTNGLTNWLPTLYSSVYRLSLSDSLRAGTLNNVAQVVVVLVCAMAIDRIGRRAWTTTCFAAGAALLAIVGSFAADSVTAVMVLVTAGGALVGSVNSVLYLYTPEIYATRVRARATGFATCYVRLASAAGQVLVGYAVDARGPGFVFLMFAAVGSLGALAATLMIETRNRRLEDLAT